MLKRMLQHLISHGRLTVATPTETIKVGEFDTKQPVSRLDVAIRLKSKSTALKLAINPDLYLGEAYMNGDLVIERGTLWEFLDLIGHNMALKSSKAAALMAKVAARTLAFLVHRNGLGAAQRNVAHHYDLSGDLYRLFLDQDLQYSCAYFRSPGDTIDQAQTAKKRHIASKLLLEPGQRVLDIGCGWGGLALTIAATEDVEVLGITLSKEQLAVARARARAMGLADRVSFELVDYRHVEGTFDRIVSVGMFEHVGTPQYGTYFETISRLLSDTGVALIHSIGKMHGPARTSSWILKYIFPGGYIPALSEVMRPIEDSGLWLTDLEILRLHYAETLRHWRETFMAENGRLSDLYDERFRRMWEFYLACSEMSFRHLGFMVFQAQLSKAIGTVPITRDYLFETERSMIASATRAKADAA